MNLSTRDPRYANYKQEYVEGSRDPLDTKAHWDSHNPLNIIPLAVAVLALIALLMLAAQ
jgi:hypothetical protein